MPAAIRKIADIVFYSNLWISLGAGSMVWETYILLGLPVDFFYVLFAFCATWAIYNLDRLVALSRLSKTGNVRHGWIVENRFLMIVSVAACTLFLIISIFYLPLKIILFLVHLGVISVAYSIPVITHKSSKRSLRSFNGLKIFLIAYVWLASTVALPALAAGYSLLNWKIISIGIRRGLFIFAITVPFDIRDLRSDRDVNLKTIPAIIGVKASQWLALSCLVIFCILAAMDHTVKPSLFYALLISGLTTAPMVFMAEENHGEYFFAGLMDGTILIQFLLVYIFSRYL
jgi:4-hydroxybenzoate polyprenyltransferase